MRLFRLASLFISHGFYATAQCAKGGHGRQLVPPPVPLTFFSLIRQRCQHIYNSHVLGGGSRESGREKEEEREVE